MNKRPKGMSTSEEYKAFTEAVDKYYNMGLIVNRTDGYWPHYPLNANFISTMVFGFYNRAIDTEKYQHLGRREDDERGISLTYSVYHVDDVPGKVDPVYTASHKVSFDSPEQRTKDLMVVVEDITWMVYQIDGGKDFANKKDLIEAITALRLIQETIL